MSEDVKESDVYLDPPNYFPEPTTLRKINNDFRDHSKYSVTTELPGLGWTKTKRSLIKWIKQGSSFLLTMNIEMFFYILRYLLTLADKYLPSKWNPINEENKGHTRFKEYKRRLWTFRNNHRARVAFILISIVTTFLFLYSLYCLEWFEHNPPYLEKYTDRFNRVIHNVYVPRLLDLKKDQDKYIANYVMNISGEFQPIAKEDFVEGFITVKFYNHKRNISIENLEQVLASLLDDKISCICGAHVGVPINVVAILLRKSSEKIFLWDPKITSLSHSETTSDIRGDNLHPTKFILHYPSSMTSRSKNTNFLDTKIIHTAAWETRCMTRCIEIASKRKLLDMDIPEILNIIKDEP